MKKKKKTPIKYILSILFLIIMVVVTAIVLFSKYDFKEMLSTIKTLDFKYIFIGILMIFIYIFFEGLATREILKAMNVKSSVADNFAYGAIDYYFCAVTPSASGGQPIVAYYMCKDKISISNTSITLLLNTALFKIVLLVLSVASAIIVPEFVFASTLLIVLYTIGFVINIGLIVLCFLGAFKPRWLHAAGKKLVKLLIRMKIVKKPLKVFHALREKMVEYEYSGKLVRQHKKEFIIALLYNFIQRIALFSVTFLVFLAFYHGSDSSGLDYRNYFELVSVQVAIALCVDSLPLPGGVGISEYLYLSLFGLVYTNVTSDYIASAMLITRGVSFYFPLILTFIIWLIKHIMILVRDSKSLGEEKEEC